MLIGEKFVAELPRKTRFYDKSKLLSYGLARLAAAKFVDDPSLLSRGRDFLERHVRSDPRQAKYYEMWTEVLTKEPTVIARMLLADTPEGDILRDTMPVFYVASTEDRRSILSLARNPEYEIVVDGQRQ